MIKATVLKDSTDSGNVIYRGIVMEGHAGYAQEGEDIICAAVSALSLNFFNSVETFTEDEFEGRAGQEDVQFEFRFTSDISPESQLLMKYKVAEGDVIKVERLGAGAGETVTFDQVLVVNNGELQIGCPTVSGATVTATVEKEGKAKKVIVYKYKRKTGYHKKNGHRQLYTQVKIDKINA